MDASALNNRRAKLLWIEGESADEFADAIGTVGKFVKTAGISDCLSYMPDDRGDWIVIIKPKFVEDADKLRVKSALGNTYVFRLIP